MILQEHREYKKDEGKGFFVVSTKGWDEVFEEIKEYCKKHPEQEVWYGKQHVRPRQKCPGPEYVAEVS